MDRDLTHKLVETIQPDLNIPKKPDGTLELSFVDAIPQHERARNSAVFNYQTSKIEKMELYEQKKLNEKS